MRRFFTKPEYVFLVPALVFGTLSALLMPQLIVNDENMHFIRSYELSELEFGHSCTIPVEIKERGFFAIYAQKQPDYSFNAKSIDMNNQIATDCGTATSYNPLLHFPQTIGIIFAKLVWPSTGAMILFGRLANVLLFALALFFIIRKAKVGKWVIVVIGLLPMMLHMAGSLSGDTVNNIVIIGFISFLFNLFIQKTMMTKKQLIMLLGLSALLAVTKLPNLALLLLVLFLPGRVLPIITIRQWRIPKTLFRFIAAGICGVAAITVVLAWSTIYNAPVIGSSNIDNPIIEAPYKLFPVLFNTYINPEIMFEGVSYSDWLMRGVVGSFASFEYYLPYSLVMMLIALILLVGFRRDDSEDKLMKPVLKKLTPVTLVSLGIIIVAITYGLYTAWALQPFGLGKDAQYALGLQGRYFTPLILLLIPLMIFLRRYVSVNVKPGATTGVIVFTVTSFTLAFYLMQTISYALALLG